MKKRYILTFPPEELDEPITYNLIKKYDIMVHIINAKITAGEEGHLVLGMSGQKENMEKAFEYLRSHNVKCESIKKSIRYNHQKCIHCGACTAVCFSGALSMERNNWELQFDHEKCIVCELCLKACPLNLFRADFES